LIYLKVGKAMTRYCIFIALLFFSLSSFGQARKLIRKGNKEFDKGNYSQAELSFRQAQAVDTASGDITYNIGNSLYMQKKYDKALGGYQKSLQQTKDPSRLAMNLHNAGNALFKMNKYQESIEAYKKALRVNPSDNQTRYNLALAQQKLKDQQKNNKDKNKQNKNDNKNNKDNKKNDQNKNKDNKDNKDNKQKQQQQQPKISKEDAQRMLDALQTGENKAQERVKAQKMRAQSRKPEKNW
jgi:tetratricopeptide (TPR) repeat protein